MSYGTVRVTHTMWSDEQWQKHTQMMVRMWDKADDDAKKAMIGDLVVHSGDLAFEEAD